MTEASQKNDPYHQDMFDRHMFILMAATAGELVNCFIGFMRRTGMPPPPPGSLERPWGEWWQQEMFEGAVAVYEDRGHSLGALQPGRTWLVDKKNICHEIDAMIKRKPGSSGKIPCPCLAEELVLLAVTDTTGQAIALRLHTSARI